MKPKEYMWQYRRCLERVRQIESSLDMMYADASVKAVAPKVDVVKGKSKKTDRTGDLAVRIADATERLTAERIEALRIMEEVASVIDAVSDPIQSRILYDRYIANMSWFDIAEDIGYDATHTRGRLHGAALEAVRKVLEERQGESEDE